MSPHQTTPRAQTLATGSAPGKIILFGEHAVVYGRPAIAVPLTQLRAYATIMPAATCLVDAVDIRQRIEVATAAENNPFAMIVRLVCRELGQELPAWRIVVHSHIPIASGLGSGAAITAAIARGLLQAFGQTLPLSRLSQLVYEVEKVHHGTPSGIDNTVVVYEQPVWFVRGQAPEIFTVGHALPLAVADTGIASVTRAVVGAVRQAWQQDRPRFEALFDGMATCSRQARQAIERGDLAALGRLMNENHALLRQIDVSSPELEGLVKTALSAGALGAKLSGAGRGGNMIALAMPQDLQAVAQALQAQARRVLTVTLQGQG